MKHDPVRIPFLVEHICVIVFKAKRIMFSKDHETVGALVKMMVGGFSLSRPPFRAVPLKFKASNQQLLSFSRHGMGPQKLTFLF